MITAKIEDNGLTLRLTETVNRLSNLKPAMEEVGKYMEGSVLRNFDSGGRPAKWKRNIAGTQTMMGTGITHRSIQRQNVTENSVEIVSSGGGNYSHNEKYTRNSPQAKKYFWYKYKDTKLPHWKYLALSNKAVFIHPQRRFMMFQEEDTNNIINIISNYIKGQP